MAKAGPFLSPRSLRPYCQRTHEGLRILIVTIPDRTALHSAYITPVDVAFVSGFEIHLGLELDLSATITKSEDANVCFIALVVDSCSLPPSDFIVVTVRSSPYWAWVNGRTHAHVQAHQVTWNNFCSSIHQSAYVAGRKATPSLLSSTASPIASFLCPVDPANSPAPHRCNVAAEDEAPVIKTFEPQDDGLDLLRGLWELLGSARGCKIIF